MPGSWRASSTDPAGFLLMFVHLHTRSWFSFRAGASSPVDLVRRAAQLDQPALALTDRHGVYGTVRLQKACRDAGLHAVLGAEILVDEAPLVLLARDAGGYRDLCQLLTRAHLSAAGITVLDDGELPEGTSDPLPTDRRLMPSITVDDLATLSARLLCLTGGREGRLWQTLARRRYDDARTWLGTLHDCFGDALYVEITHGLLPEDGRIATRLYDLADAEDVLPVVTNDVRYATPDRWRRYDLLTCMRLNHPVAEPHEERPRNAEAYLKTEAQLRRLLPFCPDAFPRTLEVAERCRVDLVPEYITPPSALIPEGITANGLLVDLCDVGLDRLYPPAGQAAARAQLTKELLTISTLELSEFFLVVREVVAEAKSRGIRCAGRGSAANSIVAYLLGITAVDPIRHNLLFERFLHGGRKGTPDIDVDFDSDRRDEVIDWMEQRFGIEQTAMTATLITYKLRLALRDVAKALGWPMTKVDELSQSVPSGQARDVEEHRPPITKVLGDSPLTELLFDRVADLHLCPRHLGLHSGGMILSRKPLSHFTPVQVSANGVKVVQFDKEDVEAMGLVKLDVLGLRMMACLSEGAGLAKRHEDVDIDFDGMPLDDKVVFELICTGRTVGMFQIESQGQMHLIAKNQPEIFDHLVAEVALFRPGPLQSGMVHPFIRRRRGWDPVVYEHPSLEPILSDTYGVILFQEQILDVAHRFAGMSLADADDFRSLMSKSHDPVRMRQMGVLFVDGAVGLGVPRPIAESVFEKVSHFVGYGFCRSHAAAFAQTVYHSAWMKRYHPAAHMAAFMQHRPGFYNLMTLEEEARRFGVPVLLPDINLSGTRYDLTRVDEGKLAIRKPLTSVKGLADEVAEQIVWARLSGSFRSVEDLATRVFLDRKVLDALARSGALDVVAGNSRDALWQAGVAANRLEAGRDQADVSTLFDMPLILPEDLPELQALTPAERLSWDYKTHGAGRTHPISLARRQLTDLHIQPIDACFKFVPLEAPESRAGKTDASGHHSATDNSGPLITVAGVVIMRQRPPTAKGFMFITLEDETGFLQCVVHPKLYDQHYDTLLQPAIIFRGQLQATGGWRGIVVREAWPLEGVFGGYSGFPSATGGQDHLDDGADTVAAGRAFGDAPADTSPDSEPDTIRKVG
ncbi:MAG TPA: DNA polymerase III subunit alpha [Candidatus Latescibacteria bacterium]|nr:DNA polymerase III subunit alpha [Candidatus Latescibacterota bacterium]HJP30453.1 DNA polymerase III subunit alpha [Candidatus Latescibacterota bacterium]